MNMALIKKLFLGMMFLVMVVLPVACDDDDESNNNQINVEAPKAA